MEVYFNNIDELNKLINEADKDQNIYLRRFYLSVWGPIRNQQEEVLFVPLGHEKYLQVFRNLEFPTTSPDGGNGNIGDMKYVKFIGVCDLKEVVLYIAEKIFYNTEDYLKYEIHIGNKKIIASAEFLEMKK